MKRSFFSGAEMVCSSTFQHRDEMPDVVSVRIILLSERGWGINSVILFKKKLQEGKESKKLVE